MKTTWLALTMTAVLLAPACKREDPQASAAATAAQQAEREAAADKVAAQFDAAVKDGKWIQARGYGEVLQMEHAGTKAAARVKPQLQGLTEKADAERAVQRLQGLWDYGKEQVKGGHQLSAAIYSKEGVDTGKGERPVRLIFRDHPDWGRSAYLVLEAGDFDCYKGCKLAVTADGKPRTLPGSRPDTDEAIAMFIDDEKALWKLAKSSKELSIEFPAKGMGKRTAVFEVGGLKPEMLPKW